MAKRRNGVDWHELDTDFSTPRDEEAYLRAKTASIAFLYVGSGKGAESVKSKFYRTKSPADNLSLQRRRDWARLFVRLDEIYCTCDSLFADQTL